MKTWRWRMWRFGWSDSALLWAASGWRRLVGRVWWRVRSVGAAKTGAQMIAEERIRQLTVEGYNAAHDDEHVKGELAQAAACYAWPPPRPVDVKAVFPWREGWKPELADPFDLAASRAARIKTLAKAGALIAAEIDRLQRLGLNG